MAMTRAQLLTPAVLAFLFLTDQGLPRLTVALAEAIMRSWSIDEEMVDRLHLCASPTRIQNMFIAGECAKKYGDLSTVEPFYQCKSVWWMDIDEELSANGFLMPVPDPKLGWLTRMVAFRSPKDGRGFPVKVRRELRPAT